MKYRGLIITLFSVQVVGMVAFFWDLIAGVLGLSGSLISWNEHEMIELGAMVSMLLGMGMGVIVLLRALRRSDHAEAQLRLASGAFMTVLDERFCEWGLTPAERDVALFALKGMSLQEIAGLRATSEGTVKAQTNAIYRKAGVSGRPQLLSLFIEDLMGEALVEAAA